MKENKYLKPKTLFEFNSGSSGKEEKHLKDFTDEEKKMIKLMANIFVNQIVKKKTKAKIRKQTEGIIGVEPVYN